MADHGVGRRCGPPSRWLFFRRIQANRCVGGVRLGEPFPVAVAVDIAGRGEHEMRGRLCAASISELLEADYIALEKAAGFPREYRTPAYAARCSTH